MAPRASIMFSCSMETIKHVLAFQCLKTRRVEKRDGVEVMWQDSSSGCWLKANIGKVDFKRVSD